MLDFSIKFLKNVGYLVFILQCVMSHEPSPHNTATLTQFSYAFIFPYLLEEDFG